jgi:hypothetical protein
VIGAEAFPIQQYGKFEKWIPACAGMTEKSSEARKQDSEIFVGQQWALAGMMTAEQA